MDLPKYREIRLPALRWLAEQETAVPLGDFERPMAEHFGLEDHQIRQEYESGNGYIFYDRISWALSEVKSAGLVDKPKYGHYRINQVGIDAIESPDSFDEVVKKKLKEAKKGGQGEELTPPDQLDKSYSGFRREIYDQILETINEKHPTEFEHLVVQLLERMGYGGKVKDAGTVTQASHDGGIDGVIREDVLGLGKVFIQAKRYKDATVGSEDVQKFAGVVSGESQKGVFVTTSSFTKGAHNAASKHSNVVLIDGLQLAEYMYDYGLGMQVEQVIEIKKLDDDFWSKLQEDRPTQAQSGDDA